MTGYHLAAQSGAHYALERGKDPMYNAMLPTGEQ
jgi:hypothetical protein